MKNILLGLLVIGASVFMHGCSEKVFIPVDECPYSKPPEPGQYLKGNDSERLVLLNMSYTDQIKKLATCNANIRLHNAKHDALFN